MRQNQFPGVFLLLIALSCLMLAASPADARDQVRIVGSSTIYPLTTRVAEYFARLHHQLAPVVESTGTGGGFKLFCEGIGPSYADIVDASRPITAEEQANCAKNSVSDIAELKIGYDGIVLLAAQKSPAISLTSKQIYLALAREIPVNGKMIKNPFHRWSEISPSLPDMAIRVYGPPPTSGTRDLFGELLLDHGCSAFPVLSTMEKTDPGVFHQMCRTLRDDGAYINAGENDQMVIRKLQDDPSSFGVMGFNTLQRDHFAVRGISIDGIAPTYTNILDGSYRGSRALYLYVKSAHLELVKTLADFISTYMSTQVIGKDGFLTEDGLVPLHDSETVQTINIAQKLIARHAR